MLIAIRDDALVIKKQNLTVTERTFLQYKYLPSLTELNVITSLNEITIKGTPAELFKVLNKISINYDIELI